MELDSDYSIWIIQKYSILDIFVKQANSWLFLKLSKYLDFA